MFEKCTTHFSLLMGHFLGQPNEALLVLKDLQPNRPDKTTYLANHKKTGLWPWTQLSASPRTVLFRWKSVVDHIDHAAPRAPRRWTTVRPRKGTTRSRGRRGSGCPRGIVDSTASSGRWPRDVYLRRVHPEKRRRMAHLVLLRRYRDHLDRDLYRLPIVQSTSSS